MATVTLLWVTAVSALLPAADAFARHDVASQPVAHVEDAAQTDCEPVHDDVTCQLCRGLRLAGAPGGQGDPVAGAPLGAGPLAFDYSPLPGRQFAASHPSRAPPRA